MSKPLPYVSTASILCEIMSGLSSLDMEPEPVENPRGPFLTDVDAHVQHSVEHFTAALKMVSRVNDAITEVMAVLESALSPEAKALLERNVNPNTVDIDRCKVLAAIIKSELTR